MKVIILAGGFGTRISEFTELIPKPMIKIGNQPILWHIMKIFSQFGHKDFFFALGYKAEVIKDYFLNYRLLNSDFKVDLFNGEITSLSKEEKSDWRVTLVDTGVATLTGGRVKRLKDFIGNETFLLTYGDGLADIDLDELVAFHQSHGKLITVTAVRPSARFGELSIEGEYVKAFKEKPQLTEGWINGGFFVIEPDFFDLLTDDNTILEGEPLEKAAEMGQLMAYKHNGEWQCMDTKRDKDALELAWDSGSAFWRVW